MSARGYAGNRRGSGWTGRENFPLFSDTLDTVSFFFISCDAPLPFYDSRTQVGHTVDGAAEHDYVGTYFATSSDGSHVAVGAPDSGRANEDSTGYVRVLEWSAVIKDRNQLGLGIGEERTPDEPGEVAMLSERSRVAIAASRNNTNGENAGHVRMFEYWAASER